MAAERKKRVMVLVGAGASLEFGAPCTTQLTEIIEQKVGDDRWMQKCGGDAAYRKILKTLSGYLQGGSCAVNFEHIYHCAHELLFTFEPTSTTVNEYRPILWPFIRRRIEIDEGALQALVKYMAKLIFEELSAICDEPKEDLGLLASFLKRLRKDHITRIYATNYDDFLLQAAPDLYVGFDSTQDHDPRLFDRRAFWQATDSDSVFHLHGSVHLAFDNSSQDTDLGDLHWFDKRATALRHSSYYGSGERRMDGSKIVRTAVITGLDKLSLLQQRPLSHYYACMARDAMTADVIYVIGYSLGDLHLNTWLAEARRMNPVPPLVFVDMWSDGFLRYTDYESDRKINEMVHTLHMHVLGHRGPYRGDEYEDGWTLSQDRNCAIWDKGFLAFLKTPNEQLDYILTELA